MWGQKNDRVAATHCGSVLDQTVSHILDSTSETTWSNRAGELKGEKLGGFR